MSAPGPAPVEEKKGKIPVTISKTPTRSAAEYEIGVVLLSLIRRFVALRAPAPPISPDHCHEFKPLRRIFFRCLPRPRHQNASGKCGVRSHLSFGSFDLKCAAMRESPSAPGDEDQIRNSLGLGSRNFATRRSLFTGQAESGRETLDKIRALQAKQGEKAGSESDSSVEPKDEQK